MSICFYCGKEIKVGLNGEEYKWCSTDCKQNFYEENFGDKETFKDGFKDLIDQVNNNENLNVNGNGFFDKNEKNNDIKKEGIFSKLWNNTIFPDMIKAKKEEKELRKQLEREAKIEALKELGPELKKAYKKKELDKLLGKKEGSKFWSKIGNELSNTGKNINIGNMLGTNTNQNVGPSADKIYNALGKSPNFDPTKGLNRGVNDDRISRILKEGKQR